MSVALFGIQLKSLSALTLAKENQARFLSHFLPPEFSSHLGFIRVNIFFPKWGKQELFSFCKQPPIRPPEEREKSKGKREKKETESPSVNEGSASND